jgi:hypothetical protein
MATEPSSPEAKAVELMSVGRLAEALPFAEKAVVGKTVCSPSHGLLATILARMGRRSDAEAVIAHAMQCTSGVPDA